jgi:hypothetical protein
MSETNKPEVATDEHLEFLDELRESGETNMFGARPYLRAEFPWLSEKEAGEILAYWMRTFQRKTGEQQ